LRKALEPVVGGCAVTANAEPVTNPLRVFDCKVQLISPASTSSAHEPVSGRKVPREFCAVREILDAIEIPYTLNDRLVRGLDYYMRTAFEFTHGR